MGEESKGNGAPETTAPEADVRETLTALSETVTTTVNDVRGELQSVQAQAESFTTAADAIRETQTKQSEEFAELRAQVEASMQEHRLSLPGAEDATERGGEKLTVGHFLLAGSVAAMQGRAAADEHFPVVAEVHRNLEKRLSDRQAEKYFGSPDESTRFMTTQVDTSGGYLVPEEQSSEFIDTTYANTVFGQVPVTRIDGLTGSPYRVSELTTAPIAYMVGEGSAITKSTPAFGKLSFEPRKVGVLFGQTREMQNMSVPAASRLAEDSARRVLGLKFEQQALEGAGANQVTGLATQSGTVDYDAGADPDTQANGRDLTGYHLARMRHQVEETDTSAMDSFGTITHTKAKNILALESLHTGGEVGALASTIGSFGPMAGRWVLTDEQIRALYGPFGHTTNISSTLTVGSLTDGCRVFTGPWAHFWLLSWGGLFVQSSNVATVGSDNAFPDDLIFTKLVSLFDAGAVKPAEFVISNDFRTTRSGV